MSSGFSSVAGVTIYCGEARQLRCDVHLRHREKDLKRRDKKTPCVVRVAARQFGDPQARHPFVPPMRGTPILDAYLQPGVGARASTAR